MLFFVILYRILVVQRSGLKKWEYYIFNAASFKNYFWLPY